ncbi:ABC transporter substrate-binding protein [Actinopolymorpha pittospori]|uniref:Multiple sugar transport system substrate-binding protein n=1 Tax=Actinopolymorpha pittospori TaxID=648752 RepID=A0A927MNN3_9ACTN|nr:extracellular solute-binding protein [Actinopolymorpha pittospori]MBE1603224.1 multiple sugar transport system substrate-binding protein [Actinopolymorpha pittospori]
MTTFDRRRFLRVAGASMATAALGVSGCARTSSKEERDTQSESQHLLRWWDQFQPLKALQEKTFRGFESSHRGVRVEYTVYNPNEMGQALQLAYKSRKIADVHSIAGLSTPPARLVKDGWFAPVDLPDNARSTLPADALLDGLHVFDDKLYSFPIFSFRQYTTLNWFNKELVERAGGDPENGPATWDEFRTLARAMTKGGVYGWIQGLQFAERMQAHLTDLAKAAGAPGETDPRTGEYLYGGDAFVSAVEFLRSLVKDKVVFPASTSLDARTGRARWVTGVAGMFFDGCWNIGVVAGDFKEFADKVGVGSIPSPEGGAVLHNPPTDGTFYISSQSAQPELAGQLLARLVTDDYQAGLATQMDQPPLNLDVVQQADVHPTYRRAIQLFQDGVRLAPTPVGRNAATAQVVAAMRAPRPTLGELVQGILSGQVADARKALREYAAKQTAERDRAIAEVVKSGAKVGVEDWTFANWTAGKDYTADLYGQA